MGPSRQYRCRRTDETAAASEYTGMFVCMYVHVCDSSGTRLDKTGVVSGVYVHTYVFVYVCTCRMCNYRCTRPDEIALALDYTGARVYMYVRTCVCMCMYAIILIQGQTRPL